MKSHLGIDPKLARHSQILLNCLFNDHLREVLGILGPGQLGPGQLGPGKETLQMTYIPPIVGRICSITEIQLKCILQMSEALCIGYILPIIGRNMSVGGFLRALSGAGLGNIYIL